MKIANLKDTVTTICGILILASGTIVAIIQAGVTLPAGISQAAVIAGVVAASVLSYFTGKNPDGTTKTTEQIQVQMQPKVEAEKK